MTKREEFLRRARDILSLADDINGARPGADEATRELALLNGLLAIALTEFSSARPYNNGVISLADALNRDRPMI